MLKLVFFYNQYASGWSETFYAPGSDPKLFANSITKVFMANAVKWRNATTVLKAIRLTRIEAPRFSYLVRPFPSPQGIGASGAEIGPDVASVDAVCQLGGTSGATRRIFFRGLSDQDVRRDEFGNDIPSVTVTKGVDLFVKGMISYNFAIRYQVRPPNGALIWQATGSLTSNASNKLWTDFQLRPMLPARNQGDVLSFTGVDSKKLPGFPRTARIIQVDLLAPQPIYTIDYALPGGLAVIPANLKVTSAVVNYESIADWQFERFSEHKTGRPFGLLRGRAVAR